MTRSLRPIAFFVIALLIPVSAFAQDAPKVGVVLSAPTGLSVIWHVSDRLAIRPEISFGHASTETAIGDTSSTNVNPGVSGLFYLRRYDNVRTYVSPRYVYDHDSSSASTPIGDLDSSHATHRFTGSWGAQFDAHRRFAIFGELGVEFLHSSEDVPLISERVSANAWSSRVTAGAIFYF